MPKQYDFVINVLVNSEASLRDTRAALVEEVRDWLGNEVDWKTRYGVDMSVDVKTIS